MNGWLLDTNVLSELRRAKPNPSVVAFVSQRSLESLYVSAVTLAEIRFGIENVADAEKRADLHHWLAQILRPMFEDRVLQVTEEVMLTWRLLVEKGRKQNYTFPQPDLLIAATAKEHGLTVVTRDTRDYEEADIPVINPWSLSKN